MRAPCAFHGLAVDDLRPRPAFRGAEDDHGPFRQARLLALAGITLNTANFLDDVIERDRHELMHLVRLVPFEEIGFPSIAGEECRQLVIAHAAEDGWVGNLVSVQVKDWQDSPISNWIQKL